MDDSYKITLEIKDIPQGLNKILGMNRHARNKYNKDWYQLVFLLSLGKKPVSPLTKAKLKITRHYYRTLDYDGLVGSMKPVVDGLTRAGIILDDRWTVLGQWEVTQEYRPRAQGPLLVVEVEEVKA